MRARDSRDAAVFASVIGLSLGLAAFVARIGFSTAAGPVWRSVCLGFFLVNTPALWTSALTGARAARLPRWVVAPAFGTLLALIVISIVLPLLVGQFGNVPAGILSAVGVVALGYNAVGFARHAKRRRAVRVTLIFLFFCAWAIGAFATIWPHLPFEALTVRGPGEVDRYFHVALANTIQNYGVVSVGIDGLPSIRYHFGTHWVLGQWSRAVGMPAFDFLYTGYPQFVGPLFFFTLFGFLGSLRAKHPGVFASRRLIRDPVVWLFITLMIMGFLPRTAMLGLGLWTIGAFFSESYALAVPVTFLAVAMVSDFLNDFSRTSSAPSPRVSDALFLLAVVPLLLALVGFLKISMLLLGFPIWAYVVVRRYRRNMLALASLAVTTLVFLAVFRYAAPQGDGRAFGAFTFIRFTSIVDHAWWPYFYSLSLIWGWVYILFRVRLAGITDTKSVLAEFRSGAFFDVELALLLIALCVAPGVLLNLRTDGIYFLDTQRWFFIPFLVCLPRFYLRVEHLITSWRSALRLRQVWALALLVLVAAPVGLNWLFTVGGPLAEKTRENLDLRRSLQLLAGYQPVSVSSDLRNGIASFRSSHAPSDLFAAPLHNVASIGNAALLQRGLERAPLYPYTSKLRELNAMPQSDKRETLMFIPQSMQVFWRSYPNRFLCAYTPLVAPALSGIALVDGEPPVGCELPNGYGLAPYDDRAREQTAEDGTVLTLCTKAKRWGKTRLLILEKGPGQALTDIKVDCLAISARR